MSIRSWTVLIYANGNNELEPEITDTIEKLKLENINDDFNIVIQLARADKELVSKLRGNIESEEKDRWSGVRRYLINDKGIMEIEVLEDINMAEPRALYEFLLWGLENYPSNNVMVILSGHGAGFIGAMTDFTYDKPYIMTLDGLINVFYKLYENTKKRIEVLLLDCCYMNLLEIWYEFSNIPFNPIKYLIVASDDVKIEGISYIHFIRYLQVKEKLYKENKKKLIDTINDFNSNDKLEDELILVYLEKVKFEDIKNSFNNICKIIIENNIDIKGELKKQFPNEKTGPFVNIVYLCNVMKLFIDYSNYDIDKILDSLREVIIYPRIEELNKNINNGLTIYMPDSLSEVYEFKESYEKLIFAYNNDWIMILNSGKDIISKEITWIRDYNKLISPIVLKRKYVLSSILEQHNNISINEAISILDELEWY